MVLKIITVLSLSTLFLVPNPIFADSKILINEFMAHPSTGNKEWVEFYNPDNVDISNYYLDDDTDFTTDSGSSSKKDLSALNKTDPLHSYLEFDSFLNNSGDKVVLFANDGTIVDQYQFIKDPGVDVSLGRSPDASDNFATLIQSSKGAINGEEKVDSTPDPTSEPTMSPSQPVSVKTNSTSVKTQSSTPVILTSKSPSPSGLVVKATPKILGESTQGAEATPSPSNPSPTFMPSENIEEKNYKVAYFMTGLGTILISSSIIVYFALHRKLKIEDNDQ